MNWEWLNKHEQKCQIVEKLLEESAEFTDG